MPAVVPPKPCGRSEPAMVVMVSLGPQPAAQKSEQSLSAQSALPSRSLSTVSPHAASGTQFGAATQSVSSQSALPSLSSSSVLAQSVSGTQFGASTQSA